mmetsp:Transcript_1691/g.2615  ORF Transcript_1691/g.2615 Transcript_1691/m.2615 type:complete len:304 (+) Transcript_1691:457-1368(+)
MHRKVNSSHVVFLVSLIVCVLLLVGFFEAESDHRELLIATHKCSSSPNHSQLLIVTAVAPHRCSTPHGDYTSVLGMKNKYDFARLQSYDVYTGHDNVDNNLKGPWNKVGLLQQVMSRTDYEWYLWVDSDTLFINMTFSIPFDYYAGKDIILWGNDTETYEVGHPIWGLNSGVMFLRNSQWTKSFLAELASLAGDDKKELFKTHMLYDEFLQDQNAWIYLLKTGGLAKYSPHVLFTPENSTQHFWKWLPDEAALCRSSALVSHFPGCQFCSGSIPERLEECTDFFRMQFNFANQQVVRLLTTPL